MFDTKVIDLEEIKRQAAPVRFGLRQTELIV